MSEIIRKMYELAEVQKVDYAYCSWDSDCPYDMTCGDKCPYWKIEKKDYPPFTAESQLKVLKMLLYSTWWLNLKRLQYDKLESFADRLANLVNSLWDSFDKTEQEIIKDILNG